MNDLYLYFSGTGNTRHALDMLARELENESYELVSIERTDVDFDARIRSANLIALAYPIYESMMPPIMEEFLLRHQAAFLGKRLSVLVTQMLFSGDGAALAGRVLKRQDVRILHTIHVNMPNNLTDVRLFPRRSPEQHARKIAKAKQRIQKQATKIHEGGTIRDGRRWYSWLLGYVIQRGFGKLTLPWLQKRLRINQDTCTNCNLCVEVCPVQNLIAKDDKILTKNQCTLCYRCINACPVRAISLFTKRPPRQQYMNKPYR